MSGYIITASSILTESLGRMPWFAVTRTPEAFVARSCNQVPHQDADNKEADNQEANQAAEQKTDQEAEQKTDHEANV